MAAPKHPKITWTMRPEFRITDNDGRWDRFVCVSPGAAIVGSASVSFPIGWVTDAASVPSLLRSIVDQLGPHLPGVLIHDRMLDLGFDRSVARRALDSQLRILPKVTRFRRYAILWGVWCYDQWVRVRGT